MGRLNLTVNEEKTSVRRAPAEEFDFLGYTFGRRYAVRSHRPYIGAWPSKRSVQNLVADIHEQTSRKRGLLAADEVVARLNRRLRGWANYFKAGPVSRCYRYLDRYTASRLRWWLCRKHKMETGMYTRFPDEFLHRELGLFSLRVFQRSLPWANA
jgi:RNA-directed DNA polymerase